MTSSSTLSLPLAQLLGHAADCVQAVRAGQSLNDALARCPNDARPGTQALAFHVLRWLGSAQAVRKHLVPKPAAQAVDALLLTAIALLWPDGDPPYPSHTLVDQAVSAARQRHKQSASFVNAVLRRFLRECDALVGLVRADPVGRHNHPAWWIEQLRADWPQHSGALLAANNKRAPMTLRVNARRCTANDYVERLAQAGIVAKAFGLFTVLLEAPCPVTRLPGFDSGDVSVQDAGAQLAAALLLAQPLPAGARVLDACAAPGGKSAHLLEMADLDLLALDSDAKRLQRVEETLSRLALVAQLACADAANTAAWWDGRPFDAILLDAPCTASGIVRRHPDVRWLRRPEDIPALARTQARLMDALWPTLRPGGRMLYCTCSVFKAEGQAQTDAFLQRHADAAVVPQAPFPCHLLPLPDNVAQAGELDPLAASPDGFYYALLHKQQP